MRLSETKDRRRPLAARARTILRGAQGAVDLGQLARQPDAASAGLTGRAVLVAVTTQAAAGAAMIALDGFVRRMVLAPPDLKDSHVATIAAEAEVEVIVTDNPERFRDLGLAFHRVPDCCLGPADMASHDTEWILLTSGTSGPPKMVVHSLAALTGAITPPADPERTEVWATFYDIRRYGGLQIFLRAVLGGTDLVLSDTGEPIGVHLQRLGQAGVTSISGTPSHWRHVLMSQERSALAPRYIRLSGEIADQQVLDGLRAAYPQAAIGHAYASTEAGVGFAVNDGQEGFPAAYVDVGCPGAPDVTMKVVDGSLRIRSQRAASRYLGAAPPVLADDEGFIDTGDLVERRGDRYYFVGRRGGIINVGGLKVNPEEVEATLNGHAAVRMSLVQARRSPVTGAIVVADVVLRDPATASETLKHDILDLCRARLDRHKVPVAIRFVDTLALTGGGKLSRARV
jgi:acyl-coenzyme A synthetase/AMP-(fatty) acid ligase